MSKHNYTKIPSIGENKDEFASTKMSNFVWMGNIPNDMYKALKDKHICNPYGNVYRKRRMSISCPSTPIRGSFKPIAQLLAEVSEKLLEETEHESHKTRCPGRRERLISQSENRVVRKGFVCIPLEPANALYHDSQLTTLAKGFEAFIDCIGRVELHEFLFC